jgi:parallel beta-helix repeat protein
MRMNDRAICFLLSIIILPMLCSTSTAKTIYVDDDAAGANNGTSWTDAYTYLQEALNDARLTEKPVEIRVAQGVYRPNGGLVAIPEFDWRTTTFQLINGVTLQGGYAGLDAPDPNARDIEQYETILSGDLNGDDGPNFANNSENSYHVVTSRRVDQEAVLDGFVIVGGNADEPLHHQWGGGMHNSYYSSPAIINCTFRLNSNGGMYNSSHSDPTVINCTFSSNAGSGMFNSYSSPVISNCTFSGNSVDFGGAGIRNSFSSPKLTDCTFIENTAEYGGGMQNDPDCSPILANCTFTNNVANTLGGGILNSHNCNAILTDCTFSHNKAEHGGGLFIDFYSNSILTNCKFFGNSADRNGGGVYQRQGELFLTHCIFSGNSASEAGGALHLSQSNPTVTNCTFVDNSAKEGNAIASSFFYAPDPEYVSKFQLINCILMDGGNEISNEHSPIDISYCNIYGARAGVYDPGEDVTWGEGNINIDPLFACLGRWDDKGTRESSDDVWVEGDFHLKSQAGRWDAGSESWIVDDVTSPCIDAGDPNSPVAFEPFPNGGIINMGAYGGTAQASKSPSGLHAKYGGGSGKPNNPYLIYTPEHMNTIGLHSEDRDAHFKLMADIDLSGLGPRGFNVIGTFPFYFRGVFDGNGHTISNFTYISTDIVDIGIFSNVEGPQAEIRDLGLIDPVINVRRDFLYPDDKDVNEVDFSRAGSLVDFLWSGTIRRCYVQGGNISADHIVGGLISSNRWGIILDCYSTADVDGIDSLGGLIGYNGGVVSDCHATGTVSGVQTVGGLVGGNQGTIHNSSAMGKVIGDSYVGGLVGENQGVRTHNNLVQGSYSTSNVTGIHDVGGLAGRSLGEINNCYSTGSVSGGRYVGGLVGSFAGLVTNCYSAGNIVYEPIEGLDRYPWVGGLVGFGYETFDVFRSFWDSEVSGQTESFGGTGLTTAQMQTAETFLNCGWSTCGGGGFWTIDEGRDYPRLWWEKKPGEPIGAIELSDVLAGEGTHDNPYLIYTAQEFNAIVLSSCDWGKHFILMSDIDLSGFEYDRAPIAPDTISSRSDFQGTPFTGVFDGNNHTISHLTIVGGSYLGLFGRLDPGGEVKNLGVVDVNIVSIGFVGGLAGSNAGSITGCYSTGTISADSTPWRDISVIGGLVGTNTGGIANCYSDIAIVGGVWMVGGLVGENSGDIATSYSTGTYNGYNSNPMIDIDSIGGLAGRNTGGISNCYSTVSLFGGEWNVGGLVGKNYGDITMSYSAGVVRGFHYVGGLVGDNYEGSITLSFWDVETSGRKNSAGGVGKTTAEMQKAGTFLQAGWDFIDETDNGTDDIWWIREGRDYPRLWWEPSQ